MSPRVTRSAARNSTGSVNTAEHQPDAPSQPPPPASTSSSIPHSRKRKAAREPSPDEEPPTPAPPSRRQSKRSKVVTDPVPSPATTRRKPKVPSAMSSAGPSNEPHEEQNTNPPTAAASSSKKSKKSRKSGQDSSSAANPTAASSSRRSKKTKPEDRQDVTMQDAGSRPPGPEHKSGGTRPFTSDDSEDGAARPPYDDDDDDDPFGEGGYLGRHGPHGLSGTLRALSGMMSGVSSRLRGILESLKQKEDPSVQLIALQELSELLLVSNEDNLAGHFSPDLYVKELVTLMQPNAFGEENPEIMLLACRCLANLMEALPPATANVVYGNAVPILCQKLMEPHFIDLAEQALSTLEKISVEFPASIVREGGLTACLTYLDFFQTSTQRTAVTTAANCCRNIPEDSFAVIRDVIPILLTVLNSSDQRVLEQGCLCVSRIVESFKYQESKLEELVSAEMLQAILRLLLPGTTNLISSNIHTLFLRVLSITARASPLRSAELFEMGVVDTLYQILTGVSPPSGTEDVAAKIDSVVIMQALIHRPREQIFETLNVICELLPNVQHEGLHYLDDLFVAGYPGDVGDRFASISSQSKKSSNDKRVKLLEERKDEVKRFAVILLPTLTDAYSSTVNLSVRQKVLTAQLKMLSNLDTAILEDALRPVPYSSYLASILSQQDHPSLVMFALQAAELLLKRLGPIYRYQFYREGVMSEISKLANRPMSQGDEKNKDSKSLKEPSAVVIIDTASHNTAGDDDMDQDEDDAGDDDEDEEDGSDMDHDMEDQDEEPPEENSESDSDDDDHEQRYAAAPTMPNVEDRITRCAKKFLEIYEKDSGKDMRLKAASILNELKTLAKDIKACYLEGSDQDGLGLFNRLAEYLDGDALESMTSYELLTSEVVQALLEVFQESAASPDAQTAFLEAFMGHNTQVKQKTATSSSPATPFSVLVHKLQDLLSRSEHFEVITVHQNTLGSASTNATSMLAKQLRIKLVADEDSGIPPSYRNIMVSIHAIATFRALDDYLRPRMTLSERAGHRSRRGGVSEAIAAYAAALSGGRDPGRSSGSPAIPTPVDYTNRPMPRQRSGAPKSKPSASSASAQPSSSAPPAKPTNPRRSTRKTKTETQAPPAPPQPPPEEATEETLECADEAQLADEDSMDEEALNAIVDDLEEEMAEDAPEPAAVNMEVASTGKVTARRDDGTRVSTPMGSVRASSSRIMSEMRAEARRALTQRDPSSASPAGAARPSSYAAALQAPPQDWHIEFTVNGQPVSNETTIYRAVHFNQTQPNEVSGRNIWSAIHTIKFKKVNGPAPTESSANTPAPDSAISAATGHPVSLDKNPTTSVILRLLSILHGLNSNVDDVISENKDTIKLNIEPLSQFVNTKLTAKLNRQLEEPLIVASNCLPNWSEDLARLYPFLFPFETRHLFLQSTSFGYSRSMVRWQNAQTTNDSRHDRRNDERPFLGRLQRQKVRISRSRILESAIRVMELYGSSPSMLEVEYFEEVGTGLGPTLEFYSTVSKEFSKKKIKLWRENESNDGDEYAFGKRGLFPAPMGADEAKSDNVKKLLHLFKILGKFVARSMMDSRIIDVSFNPLFFRLGNTSGPVTPSLGSLRSVDNDLANSLKLLKRFASAKKRIDENTHLSPAMKVREIQAIMVDGVQVEELGLDFTLPGYPSIDLIRNGSNVSVTIDNVALYVEKVLDLTIGSGVQKQVDAFREGFSQVFPYGALRAFTPDELVMLFGRVDEDWTIETLMDSIKADHGYNLDSKSVTNLLQTMSGLDAQQRRDFLQFVTGSPKLPIGGFKSLTPMFTVVCKPSEPPFSSDDYLPSVMTCVNYLKLPDYSTLDIMRDKLTVAIQEGQGAFHLS
ncbi:hypothetical protein K402DRAFT_422476 [Aulographum hederae CBS 113979]|uniref:HECT-type E3 ubiquitin transferase n=1 Tax=Aulographum hederae CBS 113979 TaxID=1176131 RepID=A0A6G1GVR3_9PEZI|nr:hypothetical protein K402DRAFT_422476 [Aulographum hederae CBS 113979]